jgi:hypothetical protein
MKKAIINPMKRWHVMHAAPRCTATSKRTRQPCRAAAVRGRTVCYHHGAAPERQRASVMGSIDTDVAPRRL